MSTKTGLHSLLVAAGSFVGGVAMGFLLTPKTGRQNRNLIYKHSSEAGEWLNRQRKTASQKGLTELQNIRKNVHDGLKQNIPDLYSATDHIDLSDHELTGE